MLPQARTRNGVGQTTQGSHRASLGRRRRRSLTLIARDEAGNEGRSEPLEMQLPQRIFVKPLARALIEQRRMLALDAERKPRVLTALDALTIAPERFTPETGIYLGLRSLYSDLDNAKSDDELREVVARMWAMAVQIEDGNVGDAEQALRAAQEALAPGARARRQRRRDQAADGQLRAAHEQVPAGAGRGDAPQSGAARAPARPQHAHAAASRT